MGSYSITPLTGAGKAGAIDFAVIAAAVPIAAAVAEWLPDGRRQGHEWVARNPMRADTRPGSFSVNLTTGRWSDFATNDRGGDMVSLWAYLRHSGDQVAAARDLAERYGVTAGQSPTSARTPTPGPRPVVPVPADAGPPPDRHPTHGKPSRVWSYRDPDGRVMLHVARFDHADGRKDICPLSWCEHPGKPARWTWAGPKGGDPRPLYGLDTLARLPGTEVLVVEGEKTADAARAIVGDAYAVVAWLGGTATADKIDLTPLRGRRVVLWPDQDVQRERLTNAEREAGVDPLSRPVLPFDRQPGPAAMLTIARALERQAASLTLVGYDPDAPRFAPGWDIADATGWTVDNVRGFIAMHGRDPRAQAGNDNPPPDDHDTPPPVPLAVAAGDDVVIEPRDVHNMQPLSPWQFPDVSERGRPLNTITNLRRLLDHYGIAVRYNVIAKDQEIIVPGRSGSSDLSRNAALADVISLCSKNSMPTTQIAPYVAGIANGNPFNPALQWIMSKPWDGRRRINDLVATLTFGPTFDPDLARLLIHRWMLSCVAAAVGPRNFRASGVLTLQGPQGKGKTAWFGALVDSDVAPGLVRLDASINPDDRDSVKQVISHWIVELGELDATFRKADIAKLKGFITRPEDELRLPYARTEERFPRRTIFGASVNSAQFLIDDTGNRRWWTLPIVGLDYRHGIEVQQLWAEVLKVYEGGERWWLDADEEARLSEANSHHEKVDVIEELLLSRLAIGSTPIRRMTATEVLIDIGIDRPTNAQSQKAAKVLTTICGPHRRVQGRNVYAVPPRAFTPQ